MHNSLKQKMPAVIISLIMPPGLCRCLARTTALVTLTALTLSTAEVLSSPDAEPESIVLEDFEGDEAGSFPAGWRWRGWGEIREKPYRVEVEGSNGFLRAEDTGQNVVLVKALSWDLQKYRYLSWRWRIRALPQGADERREKSADSAAGLYLFYRKKLGLVPVMIKFVWSNRLPAGAAFRRSGIGMPWTIVAGSGASSLNEWHTFVYDAREAYRETFGGNPGGSPLGIGILSDANNTGGRAFADYDDIVVWKRADFAERIRQFIAAE